MSTNPMHGDHLILRRFGDNNRPIGTIAFVSHLDTVYPPDEEQRNDFRWRQNGDLIYGPGTVDIKGGTLVICMVLEAIMRGAPDLFERMNWYVLLNAAEEELVPDFKQVCLDALLTIHYFFTLIPHPIALVSEGDGVSHPRGLHRDHKERLFEAWLCAQGH